MPLINLTTNLKSLKFGVGTASDRPGGGYSNQPYILKDIPSDSSDPSNVFNTGGPDSILRGGLMAPIKAINDVSRLTQMFFDTRTPNGFLFIAKQNLLSRTSVKTQSSKGAGYGGGGVNQGVYLPTSTIIQAGTGFLGAHGNLLGLNPFDSVSPNRGGDRSPLGLNSYFNIVKNQDEEDNRLVGLYDAINADVMVSNFAFQRGVNLNGGTSLLEYGGGPGSILGIGKTRINFADQRTGLNNNLSVSNPNFFYGKDPITGVLHNGRDEEIIRNLKGNSDDGTRAFDIPSKLEGITKTSQNSPLLTIDNQVLIQNFDYTSHNTVGAGKFVADRYPLESKSTLRPSPIKGEDSYLDSISLGTNQQVSNNVENNELLSNQNFQRVSPFTTNNDLISGVIPKDEIKLYPGVLSPNYKNPDAYLSTIKGTNITDSHNVENNKSLSNSNNPPVSPFTLNNNLIDQVVSEDEIKTYASTPENLPKTSYASSINPISNESILIRGASNKYNTPLLDINKIDNDFTKGEGFNVYGTLWPTTTPLQSVNNSSTYNQEQIISEPNNDGKLRGNPAIKDFRKTLRDDGTPNSQFLSIAPGYNRNKAIDQRVLRGNPGRKNRGNSYTVGNREALDKINALAPYSSTSPNHAEHNDLVKFSIGILNNDGSGKSTYIHFRSFINSFDDAYSADWGETQYVGRGDKFYNYKGFNRSISMGWTTYAQSREELIPMYKKLNYLASSLAPDYSSGGFMKGNLARLTVGGYLYNQLGIIKSITYTIPQESTWEVAIADGGGFTTSSDTTQVRELSHMITVSGFTFIPIEDSLPKLGSQFIALRNSAGVVRNYDDFLKY